MGEPLLDTLEKGDLGGLARIDRGKREVTIQVVSALHVIEP
jgi:hypothetical protein